MSPKIHDGQEDTINPKLLVATLGFGSIATHLNQPEHLRYRGRIVKSEQTRDKHSGVLVDHSTDIY